MQCPFCKAQVPNGSATCPQCGTAVASQPTEDFGAAFSNATNLWKDNLGDLILPSLVFCLVAWVPIANIGFIAGYNRSLLAFKRTGKKPEVGDIFNSWDCFVNLLLYLLIPFGAFVVLFIISSIMGKLIGILGALFGFVLMLAIPVAALALSPGLYTVIDKNIAPMDALKWSIRTVQKDPVNWLLTVLIGGIIGSLFAIITLPWGQLIVISQYEARKDD